MNDSGKPKDAHARAIAKNVRQEKDKSTKVISLQVARIRKDVAAAGNKVVDAIDLFKKDS